jgi:hypothetical protein
MNRADKAADVNVVETTRRKAKQHITTQQKTLRKRKKKGEKCDRSVRTVLSNKRK